MASVLIIEDDHQIRIAIRRALELAGHRVVEASDGEEGMDLYRQDPTDVVVTDIAMPRKDGFEVIRELVRDFPDVKIIAIAADWATSLPLAREMGADRTFGKPFTMVDITEAVNDLYNQA